MAGLVVLARETLDVDADPDGLDAALIVASQKVHDETAGKDNVRTFARVLNSDDAARLLEAALTEESRTDERLTRLAERHNQKAQTADLSLA